MSRPSPVVPRLRLAACRTAVAGARALPLPLLRLAGWGAGWLEWARDAAGRKQVDGNLRTAVPEPWARRRCVRRAYCDRALTLAESARLPHLPDAWLGAGRFAVHDPWNVFRARPLAGPAILVAVDCHWDHLAWALHRLRLTAMIEIEERSTGDAGFDRWRTARHGAWGLRALPADRAPLAALRALHEGRLIALRGDRDQDGHGPAVPFLGRRLRLAPEPAALAVQTGAPIIPLHLGRRSTSRFALIIGRPLRPDRTAPANHEVQRLSRALAGELGRFVATTPAQWSVFRAMTWADSPLAARAPGGAAPADGAAAQGAAAGGAGQA